MNIPVRVVFEKGDSRFESANFHTTFNMKVRGKYNGRLNDEGERLRMQLASIPGVRPGETSVQLDNHSIYISKLTAFKWSEIKPLVIEVLKQFFGFEKVDLE